MSHNLIRYRESEGISVLHETRLPSGTNLVRVDSPGVVQLIAQANRVSYSRSDYAASVTLDSVCYFWSAA